MTRIFFFTFLLLGYGLHSQAQTAYGLSSASRCNVNGSSTISDWTVPVTEMKGEVVLSEGFSKRKGPKVGDAIEQARLEFDVLAMKSGKGATMDDNIYEAFDAPNHPAIVFTLTQGKATSVSGMQVTVRCEGTLKMAGQSHPISLNLTGTQQEDGSYQFVGSHTLNMTQWGMEPPTAMFGAIEAGEEVTITFDLKLTEKE